MSTYSYDSLNNEMLGVMQKMSSFTSNNDKLALPKPQIEFTAIQQLLSKADLNVVVCGKVKNGKLLIFLNKTDILKSHAAGELAAP